MGDDVARLAGAPKGDEAFAAAVRALKAGEPVVFPTDTVYGLGVAVRYARSPQAIFDIKGRDGGKPVAWLVGGVQALREFGEEVPAWACALAQEHWPGALTLVVKASAAVPAQFASREGTIGLRMPAGEVALALIDEVGPLATSSANRSGCGDALRLGDVDPQVLAAVPAHLDGAGEGTASTVVDCSGGEPRVLRQGAIIL